MPVGPFIKEEKETLVWRATLDYGDPAVIKMYRRRGALTFLRQRAFSFRAEREYDSLDHLVRWSIPCSAPLFWSYGNSAAHGRFEILATREIAEAENLRAFCTPERSLSWELEPLYRIVRRMHESGLFHSVMHISNVLTVPEDGVARKFYVIDMPRSILFPHSIIGTRMAWFDLQYVSHGIWTELGVPPEEIPVGAYGLDEPGRRRFLEELPSFSRSKLTRKRLRTEALLRLGLARLRSRPQERERAGDAGH